MAFGDGPIGDFKLPLTWTAGLATIAAIAVALGLLFTGHRGGLDSGAYGAPRGEFDELIEPVTGVLAAPVRWTGEAVDFVRGYAFAAGENRRLKQEVAQLQRWKDAAIALKSINDRYEALLKLRTEPPIPSVAARITLDARGPFSNARLADAGTERGIKIGDPVLSQHGAVGRVVGVTRGASRILLLTDVDARTPVMVDRSNARGILVGDGGPYPRLDYVRGQEAVRPGDVLLTSGDGGVFPRGLPVGWASKDLRGAWRARLYADRAPIDYVRILSFQEFAQGIDPKSLSAGAALPALTPDEEKALQTALMPATAAPAQKSVLSPSARQAVSSASAPVAPMAPRARSSPPSPSLERRAAKLSAPEAIQPTAAPALSKPLQAGGKARPKAAKPTQPRPKPARAPRPQTAPADADLDGLH